MNKLILTATLIVFLGCFNVRSQIPQGALHSFSNKFLQKVPDGNWQATAWCQVTTLLNNHVPNNGKIEVDYIEVLVENLLTGDTATLSNEDYNGEGELTKDEGGLYQRNPIWYKTNAHTNLVNSKKQDSVLTIWAGQQPDSLSHFWTPWADCIANTRHKVRIRFRITGNIGMQFGLDYCPVGVDRNLTSHTEPFVSQWFGDTKGQFITRTFPDYNSNKKFDRTHYGYYTNGKFFISKVMVEYKNASSVYLRTDATGWVPAKMTLVDNFYVYETNRPYNDYKITEYCFMLEGKENGHIPTLLMEASEKELENLEDVVLNFSKDGYNFNTFPLLVVNVNENQNPEDLQITLSPDSNYLYVKSRWPINRILVTDMAGRKIYDYQRKLSEKIIIARLNTGTYIVNIETAHGNFAKKFIK